MNLPTHSVSGIPVYYWEPPPNPPADFYLLVKNGLFRVTDLPGVCQAITPAPFSVLGVSMGSELSPAYTFTGPKLPFDEHMLTVRFYQQICKDNGAEALVVYHVHNGRPMAIAPKEQSVSGAHVSYEPFDFVCVPCRIGDGVRMRPKDGPPPCPQCMKRMDALVYWGGSHSHNTMKAFASTTDVNNEATLPGVHIIYGQLDHALPDIDIYAAIVVNGHRFVLKKDELSTIIDLDDPNVRTLSKTTKHKGRASMIVNPANYTPSGHTSPGRVTWTDDDIAAYDSRFLGEIPARRSGRAVTGFEDIEFTSPTETHQMADSSDIDGINGKDLK